MVFIGGYLLVWSAIGVVPLLAYWAFARLSDDVGAVALATGAGRRDSDRRGRLSVHRLEARCLDKCQSPFAFVVTHDFGGGVAWAPCVPVSFTAHSAWDAVGRSWWCCWVVGLMNLLWMAGIFALFFVEKHWKHGIVLAKVAGIALATLGASVIAWPALLALISQ